MAFTGGFCACFFGAGSSSELDEESELVERDDGAAALLVAGLVLGLGVEALGGCSGRLHLLAAGPGTGSACVKISGLEEGVLLEVGSCAAFCGRHGATGSMALVVLVPPEKREPPALPTGWGEGCGFAICACHELLFRETTHVGLPLRPRLRRSPKLSHLRSVFAFS